MVKFCVDCKSIFQKNAKIQKDVQEQEKQN